LIPLIFIKNKKYKKSELQEQPEAHPALLVSPEIKSHFSSFLSSFSSENIL